MAKIPVFLVLALLAFSGCALQNKSLVLAGARIDVADVPMPQTAMGAHQRFEISRMSGSFQFDGYVEMEADRLVMIGFTPMGSRAFSITLENGALAWEALPFYRLPISAHQLVASWQLAYADEGDLARKLKDKGVRLDTALPKVRRFWKKRRLMTQVEYQNGDIWKGEALIRNLAGGFEVKVETRQVDAF